MNVGATALTVMLCGPVPPVQPPTMPAFPEAHVLSRPGGGTIPAWVLWLVAHVLRLTGFKNRVTVLFNWMIAFLSDARVQRTITTQQVFARQASEVQADVIARGAEAFTRGSA